MENALMINQL